MIDLGEWIGIVDTDISPWWIIIRKSEIKSFYPVNNKCDEVCIVSDKGSSNVMMEFADVYKIITGQEWTHGVC